MYCHMRGSVVHPRCTQWALVPSFLLFGLVLSSYLTISHFLIFPFKCILQLSCNLPWQLLTETNRFGAKMHASLFLVITKGRRGKTLLSARFKHSPPGQRLYQAHAPLRVIFSTVHRPFSPVSLQGLGSHLQRHSRLNQL